MEVIFHACTWVVVGTITYICKLQWAQSRMYTGYNKMNHVHLYKILWVGEGPYRLMSTTIQVRSSCRIGGLQQICG
jgi:hypothetical protein